MTSIALFAILASGQKEIISGRVLLPDGSPSANTPVALQTSVFDGWQLAAMGRTRKDGTFSIAVRDADPANSEIVVRQDGFAMAFANLDAQNSAGEIRLRKGVQANAQFVGPDHMPVQRTFVRVREIVHREPDGQETIFTTAPELSRAWKTDRAGKCILHDLPPGDDVRLEVENDRCARLSDAQAVHVDPDGKTMSLRYDMGLAVFISGRVNMDGHPVPDIKVVATSTDGKTICGATHSNWEGRYRLNRLPAGSYTVQTFLPPSLVSERTAPARENIQIEPGFFQSAVDFNLIVGPTITGTVTDAAGHPIAGELVSFYGPSHPKSTFSPGLVKTDNLGHYRIRVPAGEHQIWIPSMAWMPRIIIVKDGETRTVDLLASQPSK